MVESMIKGENGISVLDKLLVPEPPAFGAQPEQRVVFCGIRWDRYVAFDEWLGDDRPSPRLYYLDGELEMMTDETMMKSLQFQTGVDGPSPPGPPR